MKWSGMDVGCQQLQGGLVIAITTPPREWLHRQHRGRPRPVTGFTGIVLVPLSAVLVVLQRAARLPGPFCKSRIDCSESLVDPLLRPSALFTSHGHLTAADSHAPR